MTKRDKLLEIRERASLLEFDVRGVLMDLLDMLIAEKDSDDR